LSAFIYKIVNTKKIPGEKAFFLPLIPGQDELKITLGKYSAVLKTI